jgi:hypothetical protein
MKSSLTVNHRKMLCEWIMNAEHVDVAVVVVREDGGSMIMMSNNITGKLKTRVQEAAKGAPRRPRVQVMPC